ncbi:MAG: hypothetical protein WC616_02430 [Candidatus Omnitrophota bacterium]
MRELKRGQMLDHVELLLFDILQELKKLNKEEDPRPIAKGAGLICKVCNTEHENKGKLMACYRKHKKEGG